MGIFVWAGQGNLRGTIAFIKFAKRFESLKLGRSTKLLGILYYRVKQTHYFIRKNKKPRKQKNKKQRLLSCQLNSLAIQNWTVEGAVPYMTHPETVLPRPLTSKGILELQDPQTNSRPTQSKNLHFNETPPPGCLCTESLRSSALTNFCMALREFFYIFSVVRRLRRRSKCWKYLLILYRKSLPIPL